MNESMCKATLHIHSTLGGISPYPKIARTQYILSILVNICANYQF